MTNFGKIFKKVFPSWYDFLTIRILKTREVQVFYIMDAFGSFKKYFSDNEMSGKIERLIKGLDEKSIKTFRTIYARLQNYPDSSFKQFVPTKNNNIIGGILDEENIKFDQLKIKKERKLLIKSHTIHSSSFYFFHGLSLLPSNVSKYIEDKNILDLGAYTGDSLLALKDFNYKKIFSVEMSRKTIEEFEENMRKHRIDNNRYKIINCAVSNVNKSLQINDSGSIGMSLSVTQNASSEETIEIEQKTVDTIIAENNIQDLAFIKADLEGFALECVQGGINSIKKQRPILSIAIYHNPVEFFEVKPYLESELSNYTFLLRRLAHAKEYGACHAETVLLAYPNELK
ncbi:MAG: FkbM family methyltransferase [Bacteroidetes bacterium]|nr:FkbM family methyltransferase [Bacteroidota bacterium]